MSDSHIDIQALALEVQQALGQIGELRGYAGATCPVGWLFCLGQAVPRSGDYANLFRELGTVWGAGNGTTTYNVPDLRGRTLIGAGTGTGLTARPLATLLGEEAHILSVGEMPAHNHGGATGGMSANDPHSHTFNVTASGIGTSTGIGNGASAATPSTNTTSIAHTHSISSQGGGAGHNVIQPSAVINVMIKY